MNTNILRREKEKARASRFVVKKSARDTHARQSGTLVVVATYVLLAQARWGRNGCRCDEFVLTNAQQIGCDDVGL